MIVAQASKRRPCMGVTLNVFINPCGMLAVVIEGGLDLFLRQLLTLFRDAINAAECVP